MFVYLPFLILYQSLNLSIYLYSSIYVSLSILIYPSIYQIDVIFNIIRVSNSSLALVSSVRTKSASSQRLEDESEENKEGVVPIQERQVSFGSVGWFSWRTTATVGVAGTEIQVVNSQLQVDDDQEDGDGEPTKTDDVSRWLDIYD